MARTTLITATDILNRVAAEVGIAPVEDPYASLDPAFVQMRYLLNTAGEELMQAYAWEFLTREHQISTEITDTGSYPLPADFGYMINQTSWERKENIPLGGPLTPQEWTYLKGRDLAQNTLYASFRIADGVFNIYPDPAPVGLDINFEYISTNWVTDALVPEAFQDAVIIGSDKPLFDKTLITRYVKVKFLEASGFDTTKAQDDFSKTFSFLTGFDKAAPILNVGRSMRGYPYLTDANLPDTGFGL
jgi:hypothetical protein